MTACRWTASSLVETLLTISGEDEITVHIKHLPPHTVGCRCG